LFINILFQTAPHWSGYLWPRCTTIF